MATAQLLKNEIETKILNPFSEIKTEEWEKTVIKGATKSSVDSLLVNKRLIAAAFSSILYHRQIMPSVRFKSRQLDGLQFKIISDDNSQPNSDTQTVLSWIKSAFDAFEKGYLRRWLISVHPLENSNKTLETYIFHFKYKDGLKNMQLDHGYNKQQESIFGQNMREKLRNILESTIRLTNSLPPIRNNVFITSRFLYYDNVTPNNYVPEGFQSDPIEGSLDFIGFPLQLNLGRVDSPFHIVKLTSCINQQHFNCLDQADREKWVAKGDIDNLTKDKHKLDPEEFQIMDVNCQTQDILSSDNSKCNEQSKIQADCLCERIKMDSFMLYCVVCHSWQHAPCYGRLKDTSMPKQHVCLHCHNPSQGQICSDSTLLQFQERPRVLKNMTLFRQCLKLAYDTIDEFISAEEVSVKIGVDVQWVVRSFKSQTCALIQSPEDPTIFIIDKEKFSNKILPKYFFGEEIIDLNESGPILVSNSVITNIHKFQKLEQINENSNVTDVGEPLPITNNLEVEETKPTEEIKILEKEKEINIDNDKNKPPKKKIRYSTRKKKC